MPAPARASLATHRRRRVPRRSEPVAIQRSFGDALAATVARAADAFARGLEHLSALIERDDHRAAHALVDAAWRAGDAALAHVDHAAAPFAHQVDEHSRREIARQIRAAVGVDLVMPRVKRSRLDVFAAETERRLRGRFRELRDQVVRHVDKMLVAVRGDVARADAEFPIEHALQHVSLISGLTREERDQLAAEIAAAHAEGTLTRGLLRGILRARFGILGKRARLIARDQIAKLNGQVDMDRQLALGITHFTWISRGDNRVRPLHVRRHGKVYEWLDPPLTNGQPSIPGSDPLCRCVGDPVLDDLRLLFGGSPRAPGTREAPTLLPVRRLTR